MGSITRSLVPYANVCTSLPLLSLPLCLLRCLVLLALVADILCHEVKVGNHVLWLNHAAAHVGSHLDLSKRIPNSHCEGSKLLEKSIHHHFVNYNNIIKFVSLTLNGRRHL